MRTVRFELLRHGPPHNQLLSPLTEYVALCENHQAATVKLPFEHADFLMRLRRLQNYTRDGAEPHPMDLQDVAGPITDILSQVRGLIRELASPSDLQKIFHLRMILSANELALLPFELANAPTGFAGEGEPLLLQSEPRVCITREARRVTDENIVWVPREKRKILFAAAGPGEPVPLRAHLLALRQVIQPWMAYPDDDHDITSRISEHLTVLPQATLRQIEAECASGQYSHVHILAHGVDMGADKRFGLELHHPANPREPDRIDGECLAKALRPPLTNGGTGLARPVVVTLAACDSAKVENVVGAGASIAHWLHYEGIPLVIASQFPLSVRGSVIMTKVLYEGLLWGEDPRVVLVNLRRHLRTAVSNTRDWASIVAYAAFPPDLAEQLERLRMNQALQSLEVARSNADRALGKVSSKADLSPERQRLADARTRIERELDSEGHPHSKEYGRLASSEKRLAEVLWRMSSHTQDSVSEVRETLIRSLRHYRMAFLSDRSQTWALVQCLILTAVLQRWGPSDPISSNQWLLAQLTSEEETRTSDLQKRAWAYASLMELYLLAPVVTGLNITQDQAWELLSQHTAKFLSVTEPESVDRTDTSREFLRYRSFFAVVNESLQTLVEKADEIARLLADLPPRN